MDSKKINNLQHNLITNNSENNIDICIGIMAKVMDQKSQ